MYVEYRHLVPAGIKYGFPPVRDGQITSTVGVLQPNSRVGSHDSQTDVAYRTLNGLECSIRTGQRWERPERCDVHRGEKPQCFYDMD